MLRSLAKNALARHRVTLRQRQMPIARGLASRPADKVVVADVHEKDLAATRQWLANLNAGTIPRQICDISFSRSSGPGGQNVNKVNSKATLRVPLSSLYQHVPNVLHAEIRASRYYASNADAVVIQADDSRKQNDNVHSCFRKLHDLIVEAGQKTVPGEPSELQKHRVRNLRQRDNEARLKAKKFQSNKKSSRRGDDY